MARRQVYLAFIRRPYALRLIKYGIATIKKRQFVPSTTASTTPSFFDFLAIYEDSLTDFIMSYLDPYYC